MVFLVVLMSCPLGNLLIFRNGYVTVGDTAVVYK